MEQAVLAPLPSIHSDLGPHLVAPAAPAPATPFLGARDGLTLVQALLDHVHCGVTIVGPDLRLLFANQAAVRECAHHTMLRIDRNHLILAAARHHGDLTRGIGSARSGRWSLVQLVQGDDRLMLALLPLWPGTEAEGPVLMLFGLRCQCTPLAIQFYAQSCRLTPAETVVLRSLSEGLSPKQIARRQHVELSTIRSQLNSVRTKTGTRSIVELVRTLTMLPPVMPTALSAV